MLYLWIAAALIAAFIATYLSFQHRSPDDDLVTQPVDHPGPAEESALRQVRLSSHHLRNLGMGLSFHVDDIAHGGKPDIASLTDIVSEIFEIGDFMHDWATQHRTRWSFVDEDIELETVLQDAIGSVMHAVASSARNWSRAPEISQTRLHMDRRALRHVLTRLIALALRKTSQHDRIRIFLTQHASTTSIVISGLIADFTKSSISRNDLGGGLYLATALIKEQGGKLELQLPETGEFQFSIFLPNERVIAAPGSDFCVSIQSGLQLAARHDRRTGLGVSTRPGHDDRSWRNRSAESPSPAKRQDTTRMTP